MSVTVKQAAWMPPLPVRDNKTNAAPGILEKGSED
jgi:hypothetical protein